MNMDDYLFRKQHACKSAGALTMLSFLIVKCLFAVHAENTALVGKFVHGAKMRSRDDGPRYQLGRNLLQTTT